MSTIDLKTIVLGGLGVAAAVALGYLSYQNKEKEIVTANYEKKSILTVLENILEASTQDQINIVEDLKKLESKFFDQAQKEKILDSVNLQFERR